MQPIWKLYGNGSVGSQALLGIPYLTALRNDPVLASVSRGWPFETGLGALPGRPKRDCLIVHAEIYPSLVPNQTTEGEVKDAGHDSKQLLIMHSIAVNGVLPPEAVLAGTLHTLQTLQNLRHPGKSGESQGLRVRLCRSQAGSPRCPALWTSSSRQSPGRNGHVETCLATWQRYQHFCHAHRTMSDATLHRVP